MGTAKVRFGGNNQSAEDQSHFIRRRKAALERLAHCYWGLTEGALERLAHCYWG